MRAKAVPVGVATVLALSACRAEQTAPTVPGVTASVQENFFLHVTPDGAAQMFNWFTTTSQVFNVAYDYNPFTPPITLRFVCLTEGNVTCHGVDVGNATLLPGQSIQVRANYTAEMPSSGRVILSAESPAIPFGWSVQDQGDLTLTIQRPSAFGTELQVLPDNAQQTVFANGSGRYAFQVRYPFYPFAGPQTTGLACRSTGTVTCTALSESIVTLSPGETRTVYADYTTAAPGSGYLVVLRPGFLNLAFGEGGDVKLTAVAPPQPLNVSISGPTRVQKGATCTWSAAVSGGTPPYRYEWSWGGVAAGTEASISVRILISSNLRVTVWDSSPVVQQTAQSSLPVSVASVTGCTGREPF